MSKTFGRRDEHVVRKKTYRFRFSLSETLIDRAISRSIKDFRFTTTIGVVNIGTAQLGRANQRRSPRRHRSTSDSSLSKDLGTKEARF